MNPSSSAANDAETSNHDNNLASWTSDSYCRAPAGASVLTLRVGLTHENCLLFEPADLTLQQNVVTCLVGTNGSGKTSLARVLPHLPGFPSADDFQVEYVSTCEREAGIMLTATASTTIPGGGKKSGSNNHNNAATSSLTPVEYLRQVVQDKLQGLRAQIDELESTDDANDDDDSAEAIERTANQLAELYEREETLMESSEQEMQLALKALGFCSKHSHHNKTLAQLSSGWRYKCRLIAAFLLQAQLLIIDEPSFLDATSMQWLVHKIRAYSAQSMVLLISHKEQLLDALADRIWYLNSETKTVTTYNGGYTEFRSIVEAQRSQALKSAALAQQETQKATDSLQHIQKQLNKREGNFKATTRQHADKRFIKGKNKEAKQNADRSAASKVKQLRKQSAAAQQAAQLARRERIKPLHIEGVAYSGTHLACLEEVGFSYDDDSNDDPHKDNLVFRYVDAQLGPTDRILLCGENGCGKSTLVRLLLGQLEPTEGKLTHHFTNASSSSQAVYFPQTAMSDLIQQAGHLRAVDYLHSDHCCPTETAVRVHLGNFGLVGNTALRTISSLSAGQRVRLWLARQVLQLQEQQRERSSTVAAAAALPSLLILDEISENVDIETRQSLIDLLHTFAGAVLVISHDADFCQAFQPTQIWTLSEGRLHIQFGANE